MRKVTDDTTGFSVESASNYLAQRIDSIKDRILDLSATKNTNVKVMFVRRW